MGPGAGGGSVEARAFALGQLIARAGWVLLTGGRNSGAMDAASRGAKTVDGSIVIGVLPTDHRTRDVSDAVDIAIFTGMGEARNVINVLSSDVVVALGADTPGTASEVALALKAGKPVVLVDSTEEAIRFFVSCGPALVRVARDPTDAIAQVHDLLTALTA
jgi:uncharacterized protein (TIGR00725 family)